MFMKLKLYYVPFRKVKKTFILFCTVYCAVMYRVLPRLAAQEPGPVSARLNQMTITINIFAWNKKLLAFGKNDPLLAKLSSKLKPFIAWLEESDDDESDSDKIRMNLDKSINNILLSENRY